MNIVIVGCGRIGSYLANSLSDDGHDVVVIDKNVDAFSNLGATFNGVTVQGTGIDDDVLKQADIEHADAFACVTSDDNVNIMAAQVAVKIFGVAKVVARINEPKHEFLYHGAGIATVCPSNIGSMLLKTMLLVDGIQIRFSLGAGEVVIGDIIIDESTADCSLQDFEISGKVRVNAVEHDGKAVIFSPEMKCQAGDIVNITARVDGLDILREFLLQRKMGE